MDEPTDDPMDDPPRLPAVIAVLLAGGGADDALARAAGVDAKALVPFGSRPMGAWPLDAVADAAGVDRVVWVGPATAGLAARADAVLPSGRRLVDSIAMGLGAALAVAPSAPVLLLTADIPWLTAASVDRFLADAARVAPGAGLAYPIVPEAAARAAFPGQERTYTRLREGRFTGGNLALLRPAAAPRLLELIEAVYRARKSPLRLAGMAGVGTLASLLTGRASRAGLERRVSDLLGFPARAVLTDDAALAADVDRPDHLASAPAPGARLEPGAVGGAS